MKKFIKITLLTSMSLFLLIGCSSKEQVTTINNFINKLLSVKTYEGFTFLDSDSEDIGESQADLDKYAEDSKANLGQYFTENGFDTLMSNRIPYFYYAVINENNVKDITDIKIVKTKESENDVYKNYEFTHYEYEVSYKLKSDDKLIDMTDYMVFKVMKKNPSVIEEISIVKEKSSIFTEFMNSKNY